MKKLITIEELQKLPNVRVLSFDASPLIAYTAPNYVNEGENGVNFWVWAYDNVTLVWGKRCPSFPSAEGSSLFVKLAYSISIGDFNYRVRQNLIRGILDEYVSSYALNSAN